MLTGNYHYVNIFIDKGLCKLYFSCVEMACANCYYFEKKFCYWNNCVTKPGDSCVHWRADEENSTWVNG